MQFKNGKLGYRKFQANIFVLKKTQKSYSLSSFTMKWFLLRSTWQLEFVTGGEYFHCVLEIQFLLILLFYGLQEPERENPDFYGS